MPGIVVTAAMILCRVSRVFNNPSYRGHICCIDYVLSPYLMFTLRPRMNMGQDNKAYTEVCLISGLDAAAVK